MKRFALVLLALALATGCFESLDVVEGEWETADGPSAPVRAAALTAAMPEDGAVVSGAVILAAEVDSEGPVEVEFMLDARRIARLDAPPYELELDGCELSAGNHAFVVEIRDAAGNRDYLQQWFSVEACE